MRPRYVLIALFVIVLVTPLVLRVAVGESRAPGLRKGAATLVVVSPHAEAIRGEFAEAFSAWHQAHYGKPVFVDYRIYGGASDIRRYFDAAKSTLYAKLGTYQIDIVWGGGDDLFDRDLRPHLQGVALPEEILRKTFAPKDINGLPLYDQKATPPVWFGTALSSFGIVYNRDVLEYLGLPEPRTWSDLRDPRYRNWLVLADPTRSRAAQTAFMLVVERAMADASETAGSADVGWARGMGMIRQIAWNARMFTDNGSGVPAIVANGEAAAGMAIDFQARGEVDAVQQGDTSRVGYVEPIGETAINPDPVGLVKGAQHGEVAVHFIEFLLSEEGQRLWNTRAGAPGGPKRVSLRRLPIMKSVYDHPVNFTDAVNPYLAGETFNTSRARTATWPIVGDLIYMSCIATREDLGRVPVEKLDKLGMFPFDQKEALARARRWAAAAPGDRLSLQRQWTEEFRDEYRRLAGH